MDVATWIKDNQVLSGLGATLLLLGGGVIAHYWKGRNGRVSPLPETITPSVAAVKAQSVTAIANGTNNVAIGSVKISGGNLNLGQLPSISADGEQVRVDVKEATPVHKALAITGGFDVDSGRDVRHEYRLPVTGRLRIICHNLSSTPTTIDEIKLVNVENGVTVKCFDGEARKMEGFSPATIDLKISADSPQDFDELPKWRGIVQVKTVRGGKFSSEPFKWRTGNEA